MTTILAKRPSPPASPQGPALFRSAHQALLFSFTFSATQQGTAGAAERQIALQARDRYERHAGAGRGLQGFDGAAQAGMILALVSRMPREQQTAIEARFRVLDAPTRRAACVILAMRAQLVADIAPAVRTRPGAMATILQRHFGLRVALHRIADDHDVDPRTVRRWQAEVLRWARVLERAAMNAAEDTLQAAGIVESAA